MAEAVVEAAPARKKRGKTGLVVAMIGGLIVAGGGGAGFLLWKSRSGGKEPSAATSANANEGSGASKEQGGERGVLSLEPFIVNLADPEGDRYIKCTMRLVLDRPETAASVKSDDLAITRIRDRVLTLLSSKTFGQVTTPEGKESLRKEIQDQVSSVLHAEAVSEVYYTEFIVQ